MIYLNLHFVNYVSLIVFVIFCYNLLLVNKSVEVMKMTIAEATAKRILNLCDEQGISVNKLANLSAITQSTLNSIINGESQNPQLKTIVRICYGLEIDLHEFFDSDLFRSLTDII